MCLVCAAYTEAGSSIRILLRRGALPISLTAEASRAAKYSWHSASSALIRRPGSNASMRPSRCTAASPAAKPALCQRGDQHKLPPQDPSSGRVQSDIRQVLDVFVPWPIQHFPIEASPTHLEQVVLGKAVRECNQTLHAAWQSNITHWTRALYLQSRGAYTGWVPAQAASEGSSARWPTAHPPHPSRRECQSHRKGRPAPSW